MITSFLDVNCECVVNVHNTLLSGALLTAVHFITVEWCVGEDLQSKHSDQDDTTVA